jgi:toxin FitB
MIILDTNVLSALMRVVPEARVVAWLDRQPAESVWITSGQNLTLGTAV